MTNVTIKRESLDVVTVICANREHRILLTELQRAGALASPGPALIEALVE
ncbi:MAG: hypothetical protein ACFCUQ_13255 [Kiloniellales bacterium]